MTKDDAANTVAISLAGFLGSFLALARRDDLEPIAKRQAVDKFIEEMIHVLTHGELAVAMDFLIQDGMPVPEGSREGIRPWVTAIISGPGGLKMYHQRELGGSRPSIQQAAEWVLRCLANPRCVGSDTTLEAIKAQRERVS